ncbi:MAG TPA: hypothetical protein VGP93_08120, partial [Polyangiaceae bacterium]|nr:hypothetical protein [Polyangiaceae bacterium]
MSIALVGAALALALGCSSAQPQPRVSSAGAAAVPEPATSPEPAASSPSASSAPADASEPSAPASAPAASDNAKIAASPSEPTPAPFPKGTLVFHIGDSFAGSLGVPLGKRLKAAGVRYILEFETASYVPTWAFGHDLPKYIAKYNPDFVIVTLGANEIEIVNPEQRAGAVKRLVKELGGRPCLWVLPPLWKRDTGFMKVISDNAAPCRCLDSSALVGDL